jgi:hypothetical protein
MGIRGELYTTQVTLDNRSYFFNVKENRNGDVFLQVVESKMKEGEDDRRAIVVFADDMQKFLSGMDDSLKFIDKDRKERAKERAEKKAAKEAKYGMGGASRDDDDSGKRMVYRRKGESRLIAEKRAEKQDDGIKRTGRVIHVVSKRSDSKSTDKSPDKE